MSSLQPVPLHGSGSIGPSIPDMPSSVLRQFPEVLPQNPSLHASSQVPKNHGSTLITKAGNTVSLTKANRLVFADALKDIFSRGLFRWSPIQVAKLRRNMIASFKEITGRALSPNELKAIDAQIATLVKINAMAKSKLPELAARNHKAAWTVREVSYIQIDNKSYKLEMGRNFKALLVYQTAGKVIGKGGFGAVRPVGIELKTKLEVLQKQTFAQTADAPADLVKEVSLPKELHAKAGGHQVGIQRAPYSITRLEGNGATSWGVFVHRYEATLLPVNLYFFDAHQMNRYGLDTTKGQMRLFQGLFTGLAATHNAKMAHKDIKPDNIGIQKGPKGKYEACLADFGLAVKKGEPRNPSGTPSYLGKQDVEMQSKPNISDDEKLRLEQKQDMFALARSILEMFDHQSAESINSLQSALDVYTFYNHQLQAVRGTVRADSKNHPKNDPRIRQTLDAIGKEMGPAIQTLLERMLDPNPLLRPDAAQAEKIWKAHTR